MLHLLRNKRKRGIVLIITLFFMMILGLLAVALFKIVPQEHLAVRRHLEEQQSHYAATSGIKDVMAWMTTVRSPSSNMATNWNPPYDPFGVQTGGPFEYERTTLTDASLSPWKMAPYFSSAPSIASLSNLELRNGDPTYFYGGMPVLKRRTSLILGEGWAADIWVFPDKRTAPHDYSTQSGTSATAAAAFTAVSVSYRDINGDGQLTPAIGERYSLRAKANFSTDTLAKFAYFTDSWSATQAITLAKGLNRPVFDGPFHSNATPQFVVPEGTAYWDETGKPPSFAGQVTFGTASTNAPSNLNHDGLNWIGGNVGGTSPDKRPYNDLNNAIASRYNRMSSGGEMGIRTVKSIDLPTDSTPLVRAAWGEDGTITNSNIVPAATATSEDIVVNTLSTATGTAAGGIIIKGNVQKMVLEVLTSNNQRIGSNNAYHDGTNGSAQMPSSSNDGNPAVRVTMSQQFLGTTSATPTASTGSSPTSTSWTVNWTQSNFNTVNWTGPTTTSTSTQNTWSTSHSKSTSSSTSSQWWGTGGGGGSLITSNWNIPYTVPTSYSTQTNNSWGVTYNRPYSSQGAWTSNTPQSSGTSSGYSVAGGTVSYTNYATQWNQPKGIVIEVNNTPMTIQATNVIPGITGASQRFIMPNGSTATSLSLSMSNVYTIQQSKTNPQNWIVREAAMKSDVSTGAVASNYHLNGAVHVNGHLGNSNQGLSGWNKGKKTIAAEGANWVTSNSNSFATVASNRDKQIRIDGHLRIYGTPQGSNVSGTNLYKHNVGLIANNIDLYVHHNQWTNGTGVPFNSGTNKEVFVYAVMLARGAGLDASNLTNLQNNTRTGLFRLFGGLLQKNQGSIRVGDYGWNQEYNYDAQNSISPPPFFPVLNDFVIYNYIEDKV